MADLSDLATAERRDLADYLEQLDDEQWERPSLCPGWSVRDVATHVPSYDAIGWPALVAGMVRSGFSLDRYNQRLVDEGRRHGTDQLVAILREHLVPRGITAMFGSAIALTDGVIHHQDIRRALGEPREVPQERLVAALEFAPRARALPAPANVRGLRLVATDVGWAHGSGPEVRGPGEALLIAVAGRPEGLAELGGDGLSLLSARVTGVGEPA